MEIPEQFKELLLKELAFVIQKVNEEVDVDRKMYFLSATHGAIGRVLRYYLQNELLIAYNVLSVSYSMLLDRINRVKAGDNVVQISDDLIKQMVDYLSEFANAIEKNESTYPALEKIIRLAHSTTGPGHYVESLLEQINSSQ